MRLRLSVFGMCPDGLAKAQDPHVNRTSPLQRLREFMVQQFLKTAQSLDYEVMKPAYKQINRQSLITNKTHPGIKLVYMLFLLYLVLY